EHVGGYWRIHPVEADEVGLGGQVEDQARDDQVGQGAAESPQAAASTGRPIRSWLRARIERPAWIGLGARIGRGQRRLAQRGLAQRRIRRGRRRPIPQRASTGRSTMPPFSPHIRPSSASRGQGYL